jgi:hypothetical protein
VCAALAGSLAQSIAKRLALCHKQIGAASSAAKPVDGRSAAAKPKKR